MPSHSIRRPLRNTVPDDDEYVKCAVCGQWVNAMQTQEGQDDVTTYTDTGHSYQDVVIYEPVVPVGAAHWFCGSGRWRDGRPGPLKG